MDDVRPVVEPPVESDPQLAFYEDKLQEKYCKGNERTAEDVFRRVANGLAQNENPRERRQWESKFFRAMMDGFYPAGRIASACGTDIAATLINCFVQPIGDTTIGHDADGRPGIFLAQMEAAETMRRAGGEGYNFSRLRPRGALVKGTRSVSGGPIAYMMVFDRACGTVSAAGSRRGAQMGVMNVEHPDIREFIVAKDIRTFTKMLRERGLSPAEVEDLASRMRTLSNFNISVAVSHAFMECVRDDRDFELVHEAEPDIGIHPNAYRREDGLWVYNKVQARELWDLIMQTTYETADPGVLFIGRINSENNLRYCETIEATNPCGEQPLPPYGCCCLGSVNLAKLVRDPFTDHARFDEDKLLELVTTAVRMLDNVLDLTYWPLDQQRQEAHSKRRIGLGFTGLATAMVMQGLRYGSDEATEFARRIAETMRDTAYRASIELGKERGKFPMFDEKLLDSGFARRLPESLRDEIRKHGLRNSHLLSIAPTGTISLTFGQNVSSGIEPAFAWEYSRRAVEADGSFKTFPVQDLGYRAYLALGGDPDHLPDAFVNAQTLTPADHLRIVAAVQPYIDTSISKTINAPAEISFEDFKDIYLQAWSLGLKGCTTYRPNDVTGAVLSVDKPADRIGVDGSDQEDPQRRVRLSKLPQPPLASLRWPSRPSLPGGNPSMTYMVEDGDTKFAVFVGHVANGSNHPFEVWVNGSEQPAGLGATAKLLSMDMRLDDYGWLQKKLDALIRTPGSPIRVAMPPDGQIAVYGSATAAMAALVKHRCTELGVFDQDGPTPVLDALMSNKEPKTGSRGTMSWTVDVRNPAAGDDFVLMLKELEMPDGGLRPYSVWLAGEFPNDLNGLCKLLSLDMRVMDPAWIGEKLRKLITYAEPRSEFMAPVPGQDKQIIWPSTAAYIGALVLHRFVRLGILDADGKPITPMGILASKEGGDGAVAAQTSPSGSLCPECGTLGLQKYDGCERCRCGYIGSCG